MVDFDVFYVQIDMARPRVRFIGLWSGEKAGWWQAGALCEVFLATCQFTR